MWHLFDIGSVVLVVVLAVINVQFEVAHVVANIFAIHSRLVVASGGVDGIDVGCYRW